MASCGLGVVCQWSFGCRNRLRIQLILSRPAVTPLLLLLTLVFLVNARKEQICSSVSFSSPSSPPFFLLFVLNCLNKLLLPPFSHPPPLLLLLLLLLPLSDCSSVVYQSTLLLQTTPGLRKEIGFAKRYWFSCLAAQLPTVCVRECMCESECVCPRSQKHKKEKAKKEVGKRKSMPSD